MNKIGVVGDIDSVKGFLAVGFDVFAVKSAAEAEHILKDSVLKEYAVLYVTEQIAEDMASFFDRYKDSALPAVVPIPGNKGPTGFAMANVKKSVERAVGADIL